MSIAMDRIEPSGCIGGGGAVACGGVYKAAAVVLDGKEEDEDWCSSSSTSSIGRNSDLSGRSSDSEENEVQSSYKGPSLLVMDSLEEALPTRRGISKFYNGKSKSYTSLVEASDAASVKDIAKQENVYTRRRRNLLAVSHIWDKNRCSPLRNMSKRPISSSRSSLALAVAMSSSESISSTSEDSSSNSRSPPRLPPLHPQSRASAWRSYSVADLRHCTADATTNSHLSFITDKTDYKKKPI